MNGFSVIGIKVVKSIGNATVCSDASRSLILRMRGVSLGGWGDPVGGKGGRVLRGFRIFGLQRTFGMNRRRSRYSQDATPVFTRSLYLFGDFIIGNNLPGFTNL